MWLFTTQGFYSVVADRDDETRVLVRARAEEDLKAHEQQIPDIEIHETLGPDHDSSSRTPSRCVRAQIADDVTRAFGPSS